MAGLRSEVDKQDLLDALVSNPRLLLRLMGCDLLQSRAEDGHRRVYAYSLGEKVCCTLCII